MTTAKHLVAKEKQACHVTIETDRPADNVQPGEPETNPKKPVKGAKPAKKAKAARKAKPAKKPVDKGELPIGMIPAR